MPLGWTDKGVDIIICDNISAYRLPIAELQGKVSQSKSDLIFHPVRMRILQVLLRADRLTPGELGVALSDVPPATLYRHINRLAKGGVIEVVEERPVRGVVERVYAVNVQGGAYLSATEMEHVGREDHIRYFAVFLAGLLDEFERYLEQPAANPGEDGVGYRQFPVYLNDEELDEFLGAMNALILRAMRNEPQPDRTRRVLTRIIIPSKETTSTDGRDEGER